jgi:hypothetical protein
MATKILVKKQSKAVKQVETEIIELIGSSVEDMPDDVLEKVSRLLRDFYICIENALGFIGHNLDGSVPSGEDVHRLLLDRMADAVDKVRPPVLDKVLREELQPYLQFRLDLEKDPETTSRDKERIIILIDSLKAVSATVRQQLTDFFGDVNKFHGFEQNTARQ